MIAMEIPHVVDEVSILRLNKTREKKEKPEEKFSVA